MYKIGDIVAGILIIGVVFTSAPLAQQGIGSQGSQGSGIKGTRKRMYDPKTVETVSGEVVMVYKCSSMLYFIRP